MPAKALCVFSTPPSQWPRCIRNVNLSGDSAHVDFGAAFTLHRTEAATTLPAASDNDATYTVEFAGGLEMDVVLCEASLQEPASIPTLQHLRRWNRCFELGFR